MSVYSVERILFTDGRILEHVTIALFAGTLNGFVFVAEDPEKPETGTLYSVASIDRIEGIQIQTRAGKPCRVS